MLKSLFGQSHSHAGGDARQAAGGSPGSLKGGGDAASAAGGLLYSTDSKVGQPMLHNLP